MGITANLITQTAQSFIGNQNNVTLAHQIFFPERGVAKVKQQKLRLPQENEVLIKTIYSGVSRGTERLVFTGQVPKKNWQTMKCPYQQGDFSFPISYGYACVGEIVSLGSGVKDKQIGDKVFALHPHHSHFLIDAEHIYPLPSGLSPDLAVLSANMETALNATWDAEVTNAENILVIGAGVVGLLTAFLAAKEGASITIADIDPAKQALAKQLGLDFIDANQTDNFGSEYSTIFNTSASQVGLQSAIDLAAIEGKIIEMSWFGSKKVSLELGGNFHSKRLKIIASQVGMVAPSHRQEYTHSQRLMIAMNKLSDLALMPLLHPIISVEDVPQNLAAILDPQADALCPLITYDESNR